MRYDATMRYVLMLMLVLASLLPCSAGEREEALLNGLLGMGVRALEAQVAPQTPAAGEPGQAEPPMPFAQSLAGTVRQAMDGVLEEYKQEGRAYAREVGDIVVQRVTTDPEIHSALTSVRTLCWVVIAYLTLVTLIMLGCLVYLRQANARLLARVEEIANRR